MTPEEIHESMVDFAEARIRETGMYEGQERITAEKMIDDPEFEHPPISQYSVITGANIEQREYCICGHIHREGMV